MDSLYTFSDLVSELGSGLPHKGFPEFTLFSFLSFLRKLQYFTGDRSTAELPRNVIFYPLPSCTSFKPFLFYSGFFPCLKNFLVNQYKRTSAARKKSRFHSEVVFRQSSFKIISHTSVKLLIFSAFYYIDPKHRLIIQQATAPPLAGKSTAELYPPVVGTPECFLFKKNFLHLNRKRRKNNRKLDNFKRETQRTKSLL